MADCALTRNRADLDRVQLHPHYLKPGTAVEPDCTLFGQSFGFPCGVSPIGLSGLIWPRSTEFLAAAAKQANIPFILSTVASTAIETAARYAEDRFWFQLYPPPDRAVSLDLMRRAKDTGCKHLVVTIDVPALGRRPRDIHNGLGMPPAITVKNIWQSMLRPAWSMATLRTGVPRFETLEPYMGEKIKLKGATNYVRNAFKEPVDENVLKIIRDQWPHHLIVKGILTVDDAHRAITAGADGLIISNHGGRQLDAAPSTISVTREIADAVRGKAVVMADSGVESGVDIARFLANGAQMVFAGRAFMYGVGALGKRGAIHAIHILEAEFGQTLGQLGCRRPVDLPEHSGSFAG